MPVRDRCRTAILIPLFALAALPLAAQELPPSRTQKPPLHARHWLAITGKPLAATAGAMMFQKGGNAVDAAAAMLAATCTMWDSLSWGGETQALIYHPRLKKVIGINALGVAPTGATAAFYRSKGHRFPPEYGPLAAVTPGNPGGLMTMLAEYGTLSLADVLAPAIQMADGYPIEAETVRMIRRHARRMKEWKYTRSVFFGDSEKASDGPEPGEIFAQPDLAATLRKLVEAEQRARRAGRSRRGAIYAAYDRFYRGDVAQELARGTQEEGGLIAARDLAEWQVKIEEPTSTDYRGITVYKLPIWQQGPAFLQALNMLENLDVKAMGYNSPRYVHTLYQVMNLAFADRDFYYGDPAFPPEEPVKGLLSKEYAKSRLALLNPQRNDPNVKPGDPYPFQGGRNPFADLLAKWPPPPSPAATAPEPAEPAPGQARERLEIKDWRLGQSDRQSPIFNLQSLPALDEDFLRQFTSGTTSIEAADEEGWVVSVTPSGGWIPAVIAGRTGVGLSQRAQSFVTEPADGPYNVIEPGKRPRVTLTPTLALKEGSPYLAFAVQGGDTQDQNLLQFFLNVVDFGMTPQLAAEAWNVTSYQMRSSFGAHGSRPGRLTVNALTPPATRRALEAMGYTLRLAPRSSGPINAIWFDRQHGSMWGASSNDGEDYGIAW